MLRQTVLTPRLRQITSHGHQVGPLGCRHPADIVARYMFIVVRVAWPTSSYHYSCSLGLCSCTRLSMTIIPGQGLMTLPGDGSTHCSLCHPHSPRRHQQSATRDQPDFLLENGPQIGSGRAPGVESRAPVATPRTRVRATGRPLTTTALNRPSMWGAASLSSRGPWTRRPLGMTSLLPLFLCKMST